MSTRTPQQCAFRRFSLATAFAVLLTLPTLGQTAPKPAPAAHTTPAQKQTFEVASIRLEDPHTTFDPMSNNQPRTYPANRLTIRHTTLKSLVNEAFGVKYNYVLGGPAWIDQQHYDLNTKVQGDTLLTQEQMRPLLQNLLEERFHLKTHREQKIVPGYALVVAKSGPKLRPTKGDTFVGNYSGFEIDYKNVSVANFGGAIGAWVVKQPVVDKTGIQGYYDIDLKFAPETGPLAGDPRGTNLPDIFTAMQEQLGLKLVAQKVTVDTLVIDHADRIPTEN